MPFPPGGVGMMPPQQQQPQQSGAVGMAPPQQSPLTRPPQQGGMVGMAPPQPQGGSVAGVGMPMNRQPMPPIGLAPPQQRPPVGLLGGAPGVGMMPPQRQPMPPAGMGMAPPQQGGAVGGVGMPINHGGPMPPQGMGGPGVGMMPPQNGFNPGVGMRPPGMMPPQGFNPVGGFRPGMGMMPPQPPGGIEQQALNGGGVDNKQQVSNFMNALGSVGAGGNNRQMGGPTPGGQFTPNLIDPNVAYQNNGSVGQNTFQGGQNAGQVQSQQGSAGGGVTPGGIQPQPTPPLITPGGLPIQDLNQQVGQGGGLQLPGNTYNSPGGAHSLPGLPQTGGQQMIDPSLAQQYAQNGMFQNILMSDETQKTNIEPSSKLQEFMKSINAYDYQYKDPERDGKGTFTSPMAQELEKTDLGKQAVINTPRGKMVDYQRLGAVTLSGLSVLHKENQRLQRDLTHLKMAFIRNFKRK